MEISSPGTVGEGGVVDVGGMVLDIGGAGDVSLAAGAHDVIRSIVIVIKAKR
jgi:hypothetical protein